ncbi:uncharacterized protein METZ01_LOCUS494009, partial [marine metagenome]
MRRIYIELIELFCGRDMKTKRTPEVRQKSIRGSLKLAMHSTEVLIKLKKILCMVETRGIYVITTLRPWN